MTHWFSLPMLGLCVVGLAGCSAEVEGNAEPSAAWNETRALTLLGKLDFDNGSTLEFYEAFEGALVLSGAGPISSPPPQFDRSLKPVQIFKMFAPQRAVPEALVEAQTRADALTAASVEFAEPAHVPIAAPVLDDSKVGTVSAALWGDNDSACPWSWFSSAKCVEAQTCLGFVDGAKSIQHDDVKYSVGMTCNYRNGHNHLSQYRTWFSWTAQGTWFVPPGYYRYAEMWNATLDFDSRVVVQANGSVPGSHLAMRSSTGPLRVGFP